MTLVSAMRSQPGLRAAYARYVYYRDKLEHLTGKRLWAAHPILTAEEANARIADAISSNRPFAAGKIGANEQNLLLWADSIPIPLGTLGLKRTIGYHQTHNCESNAGLVPRSIESYRDIATTMNISVRDLDLLGIWFNPGEYMYLEAQQHLNKSLCYFFGLEPFFVKNPWTEKLSGRRVLLVSPFAGTAERQFHKLNDIWPNGMVGSFDLKTYKFPYLFSKGNTKSWRDAYDDFAAFAKSTEFDVALIGVGGLSLMIAKLCRDLGKQAIHLGGATQLLFGIRASRYEADPKYAALMNDAWVRPARDETPPEAGLIEANCYW